MITCTTQLSTNGIYCSPQRKREDSDGEASPPTPSAEEVKKEKKKKKKEKKAKLEEEGAEPQQEEAEPQPEDAEVSRFSMVVQQGTVVCFRPVLRTSSFLSQPAPFR